MSNTKSAFISFDYDHDKDLRGQLVRQSQMSDSPFSITDWSVQEPIDENWKKEVLDRIQRTDLTIVICGEHTHDAKGVEIELTFVHKEKKPYFLLQGRRNATCTKPKQARSSDEMHTWTWNNLKELIANAQ